MRKSKPVHTYLHIPKARQLAFAVLCAWLTAAGCAWEDTAYQAAQSPKYLRLQDHIRVAHTPRWTLPLGSAVEMHRDNSVPAAWSQAAQRGLNRYFNVVGHPHNPQPARYFVTVHWPLPAAEAAQAEASRPPPRGFVSRTWRKVELPHVPDRQQLWVSMHSADGHYREELALHFSPKLWGRDWHAEDIIEAGFAQLAESLTGR